MRHFGEGSVKRQNVCIRRRFQRGLSAANLAFARQKAENIAFGLLKGVRNSGGDRAIAQIARFNGVHTPLRGNADGVPEVTDHFLGIECRGHHEKAQIGSQGAAHFESERKGEVASEGAFVELIKDYEPCIRKFGVAQNALREESLSYNLKARRGRNLAFEADTIADHAAEGFAALGGDVLGTIPRG